MTELLDIQNLSAGYGTTTIIHDINICLSEQQVAVIVGPNGAGKSTVLKAVFGLNTHIAGDIRFKGQSIVSTSTSDLVPMGIAAVPQTNNVFASLTINENLEVGTYAHPPADKAAVKDNILQLFPDLRLKLNREAATLSGGQRQMLAIGRALMSEPDLLLLDEPTAGLSPAYLEIILDLLQQIANSGVTILMVEQNARQALRIAHTGYVLVNGRHAFSGSGRELLANEEVRRSFLGGTAVP